MSTIPAHIASDGCTIHTIEDHSRKTAEKAAQILHGTGLESAARLAGLLHDMGKATFSYAMNISHPTRGDRRERHSYAAVRYILTTFHSTRNTYDDLASELIAYAAGAHHSLFDLADGEPGTGFSERVREDDGYREAVSNFFSGYTGITEDEALLLFKDACSAMNGIYDRVSFAEKDLSADDILLYMGLTARILLSAVVEADREDTAEFYGIREERAPLPRSFWAMAARRVQRKFTDERKSGEDSIRRQVSYRLRRWGNSRKPVFTMEIPPRSGFTEGAMRFALSEADNGKRDRIIYVTPLGEGTEEAAGRIRALLGSKVEVREQRGDAAESDDALFSLSWDAPVNVTGLSDFLLSLYSSKISSVKRFCRLSNAVIVIEGTDTLPINMRKLFAMALNWLTGVLHSVVLLASPLQKDLPGIRPHLPQIPEDMLKPSDRIWNGIERPNTVSAGDMALDMIPSFIREKAGHSGNVLVASESEEAALHIRSRLKGFRDVSAYISVRMCPMHRKDASERLQKALAKGKQALCIVSGPAIPDLSFHTVIHITESLGNLLRATEHAESGKDATVYTVTCTEVSSNSSHDGARKKATAELLSKEDIDIFSRKAQSEYRELTEKFREEEKDPGEENIFRLLSSNRGSVTAGSSRWILQQAFRTAGELFLPYGEERTTVIVPYREGHEIIKGLLMARSNETGKRSDLLMRALPYTVEVPSRDAEGLMKLPLGITASSIRDYSEETGLRMKEKAEEPDVQKLILRDGEPDYPDKSKDCKELLADAEII